ncbi:diacylglycerol kinase (ATP) [Clostridiales Family XIII bacterium PM5-7]
MKNYFFVNPVAGQGKGIDELINKIRVAAEKLDQQVVTHITQGVGDGEAKAREIAESLNGEPARFFACGGDGTTNEIINGVVGFDEIAVGCVPIGTGNDTMRSLDKDKDFLDIEAQLLGTERSVDLIQYEGVLDGTLQKRYCINMVNIGFDCNVVELAARLKQKPLIEGSLAYLLAVIGIFIKKKGISLKLWEGDQLLVDGEVLLCAIANGAYCGGGMNTSPQSLLDDGVFDLNIVKDVTRLQFLNLFPKYKKGTHLSAPGIEKVISIKECTGLTLEPYHKHFFICVDGEIYTAEKIQFNMVPRAIRVVVPK